MSTPCPRCGGPQILLLTSWACKAECDLRVHVDKPLTNISLEKIQSGGAFPIGQAIAGRSFKSLFTHLCDRYSYLPVSGLTSGSLYIGLSRWGGPVKMLQGCYDYDLFEVAEGYYQFNIFETVPNDLTGCFVQVAGNNLQPLLMSIP